MSPSESVVAAFAATQASFTDDERLGTAFQRALSREHDVVVVEVARPLTTHRGESFDVIFCDVGMPSMTGAAFYEAVQRSLPRLASRIVLFTGGGERVRAKEFAEMRNAPLLDKPLDVRQVKAILDSVLPAARQE